MQVHSFSSTCSLLGEQSEASARVNEDFSLFVFLGTSSKCTCKC